MNTTVEASALDQARAKLKEFWKDDFVPLQAAGALINSALRADEENADLYHRIFDGNTPGSHLYFPAEPNASMDGSSSSSSTSNQARRDSVNQLAVSPPSATSSTAPSPQPPPTAPPLMRLQHRNSVDLPLVIVKELAATGRFIQMGLLSEARLAWTIVDEKLYVWSYESASTAAPNGLGHGTATTSGAVGSIGAASGKQPKSFAVFTTPSREPVGAVGLVRPKPGVFKPFVEWCLFVSTPSEVFLCVLIRKPPTTSQYVMLEENGSLELMPTVFCAETEHRVTSIVGTDNGRVFLGCVDGSVYEFSYENSQSFTDAMTDLTDEVVNERLNQFYDEDKPLDLTAIETDKKPLGIGTLKRAIQTVVRGSADPSYSRPTKRSKIQHVANIPTVIGRTSNFLFGGRTASMGSEIVQTVVDNARGCMYTLDSAGWICAFACDGTTGLRLAATMNSKKTAQLYLEAVSRGQVFPPSNGNQQIGILVFPGGGASAQAGVGGMEGARAILKLHEQQRTSNGSTNATVPGGSGRTDALKPVSIHVVSTTESSRLTLVAVTEGGLRLYLSSLDSQYINSGPSSAISLGGGRFRNGSNRSSRKNPLSPSRRLTLCHIRAPPAIIKADLRYGSSQSGGLSSGILGGYSPGSGLAGVGRALYNRGVFVAAVKGKPKSSNGLNTSWLQHEHTVGDTIVATCPDIIARKREIGTAGNGKGLARLGGVTESTTLPMAMAYGGGEASAVLPGGTIWSMAETEADSSAMLHLTANSKTPTETELGIGLPRVFDPRSTRNSSNGITVAQNLSGMSSSSNAIVRKHSMTLTKFVQDIVDSGTKLFLPRSMRPSFARVLECKNLYRVSKRRASKGFSSFTGDKPATNQIRMTTSGTGTVSTKTAQLRHNLLHPATVPLVHSSAYLYSPKREIVALNAAGLHYFDVKPVSSFLAEALMTANDNAGNDRSITAMFEGYGFSEGCCMCLALAIGCVPGGNDSVHLKNWAANAAWNRANVPKLIRRDDPNRAGSIISGVVEPSDGLIPSGYEFQGSELYKGFAALLSRLVRPIWHKPAVVVTDGPLLKEQARGPSQMPAKVELLLDDDSLNAISSLLRNLHSLVKERFELAIAIVPGEQQESARNAGSLLLNAMQFNLQPRSDAGSGVSASEAEKIARLTEEKNVHSLFRLLNRIIHLLNLFAILGRVQADEVEIEWGLLHGLTFAQLVQTSEGQDRIESLLNSIVTAQSTKANDVANEFSEKCYLFFSPASHFANLGLQKAKDALSLPIASSSRKALSDQAARFLCRAAQHWFSAPLITGRVVQGSNTERFRDIVNVALRARSPLAMATIALMKLNDVSNVVKVCLITAANFKCKTSGDVVKFSSSTGRKSDFTVEFAWEQNLYHVRRTELQRLGGNSSPKPINGMIDDGAVHADQDAVKTCYALIFYHLQSLLDPVAPSPFVEEMVSTCAAEKDHRFLEAFFSFLVESENADTLLRIKSDEVEQWLQSRNDIELLWRYYQQQDRHRDAAQLAKGAANTTETNVPLAGRINWLQRAENSLSTERFRVGNNADPDLDADQHSLRLSVGLANIQSRIFTVLRGLYPQEDWGTLGGSLLSLDSLYNDFAAPMDLLDECLLILDVSNHLDAKVICPVWKGIILEEILPCATYDKAIYDALLRLVENALQRDSIMLIPTASGTSTRRLIEDGTWVISLVTRIERLGESLGLQKVPYGELTRRYAPNPVFPVEFILSQLEALQSAVASLLSPGWCLITLADAGVSFLDVIEAYDRVMMQRDHDVTLGAPDVDEFNQISAKLEFLEHWLSVVSSAADPRGRRTGVHMELRNVRFARQMEAIRAQIGRTSVPTIQSRYFQLEESAQALL